MNRIRKHRWINSIAHNACINHYLMDDAVFLQGLKRSVKSGAVVMCAELCSYFLLRHGPASLHHHTNNAFAAACPF